ncbi:hypothetical protein INS49_011855 [Diaporthe citri]|uniref:uncharacterized protein n=1 Tax=Diaporthe citri TaxID=83186 RepID=UPI001C7F73E4|nr:uncharacterized protein INS49_011855 [Diaporthe citri]KAG6360788.1 hypothetical protein INS49_011855 [Diaporthe citri]
MRFFAWLYLSAAGVVLAAPTVHHDGLSYNDVLKRDGSTEFDADALFFKRDFRNDMSRTARNEVDCGSCQVDDE